MDNVTLIGADSVYRAGMMIQSAAEDFGRHVGYLNEGMVAYQRTIEGLVARQEVAAQKFQDAAGRFVQHAPHGGG